MDRALGIGYEDFLDKTTEFLKKRGRGKDYDNHTLKINGEKVHNGIKFVYPFFESKEEISIDLFLSPNFPRHDELLTSLQQIDDAKKRRM